LYSWQGGENLALATKQESVVNQETNYYDEIDQILSTQYITIGPGEKKVLKFVPERGMTKVEKMYNGEPHREVSICCNRR
jgi:hypothetical protein